MSKLQSHVRIEWRTHSQSTTCETVKSTQTVRIHHLNRVQALAMLLLYIFPSQLSLVLWIYCFLEYTFWNSSQFHSFQLTFFRHTSKLVRSNSPQFYQPTEKKRFFSVQTEPVAIQSVYGEIIRWLSILLVIQKNRSAKILSSQKVWYLSYKCNSLAVSCSYRLGHFQFNLSKWVWKNGRNNIFRSWKIYSAKIIFASIVLIFGFCLNKLYRSINTTNSLDFNTIDFLCH